VDLNAPKKAYLELLAQPEHKIEYVPREEITNMYNTPIFKSLINNPNPNGITAQPRSAKVKHIIGDIKKII